MTTMKSKFTSLDRHLTLECEFDQPDRYRQLVEVMSSEGPIIPRGSGLSYAPASFSGLSKSIDFCRFDRILGFDADARIIEVETGITLGQLFEFLSPLGLHISVQPGHPQITVGGCIAGNVHGKNQYSEGVFGGIVESLTLLHPDHGELTASRDLEPEVFALTVGGFGLTGLITKARLRLSKLPGTEVRQFHESVSGLKSAFHDLDIAKEKYDMCYCWVDLTGTDIDTAPGFIIAGEYTSGTKAGGAAFDANYKPLDPSRSRFRPPVFNNMSLPYVNRVFRAMNRSKGSGYALPLFAFMFPAVGKEFYFDFFGKQGFVEMQVLLPADNIDDYLDEFGQLYKAHGKPIALTTVKCFSGDPSLLHFNGTGFNFTIEVQNTTENLAFLTKMDGLNTSFGGISNIIKDSRLSLEVVAAQFPEYTAFKERLRAFDPNRRLQSDISERLGL
jgi:decaprenylphospho-beta-D-ribofuranose 2-oxidase